jgi:hypothetical protein
MGQSAEAGVAAPQPDWRYRELQSARRGRHKGQLIGTEKRPLQHLARFILIGVSLCPSLPRRDARGSCSNASLSAAIGPNKPRSQAEQGQSTLYLCFRRRRGCDGCLPAWRAHDPDPARPPYLDVAIFAANNFSISVSSKPNWERTAVVCSPSAGSRRGVGVSPPGSRASGSAPTPSCST